MMNKYYVYIHIRDGKIVYCGKGIKKIYGHSKLYDRAFEQGTRKYNVKDVEVKKIRYFDNEQEALYFEEKLTKYLKSIGQCEYNIDIANKHGEEARQKMSKSHKGKTFSDEHRKKLSECRKGEKNGMYGRTGVNNAMSIKVIAFTDSGSYHKEFASIKDAERELRIDQSGITKCCKGKLKSAGKYKGEKLRWKYKEKY